MNRGLFGTIVLVLMVVFVVGTCSTQKHPSETPVHKEEVNLAEFECVRNSLYDAAMTVCTGLAEYDGSCFYGAHKEYVEIFLTYRVPSLEVLLGILDEIDDSSSLWDVYDDDEGTLDSYYTYRERYENFF